MKMLRHCVVLSFYLYAPILKAKHSGKMLTQLYLASRAGTARELYEETGVDVRGTLDRMRPAILRAKPESYKDGRELLPNEYKHRIFFVLSLTDKDFVQVRERLFVDDLILQFRRSR
jgi:hypothetical protein